METNLNRTGLISFFLLIFLIGAFTANVVNAATFNPTTTQELIDDLIVANSNGESDTINLVPGMTYTIGAADATGVFGLPSIQSDSNNTLEIFGNGALIQRDPSLFSIPDDPCTYQPMLTSAEIGKASKVLPIGKYMIPLVNPK